MLVIHKRNVHDALPEGLYQLVYNGRQSSSRAGDVLVYPTPVTTVYDKPCERVVFWPSRDCNHTFHFFEALYYLAGRRAVEPLAYYNPRMRNYSDNGVIFHGSYGFRWRSWFGVDQLERVIQLFKNSKGTRRAVICMWDPKADLQLVEADYLDIPCNDLIMLGITDDKLDIAVCCRSNDIIWGCYGANAVQFSFLQEYLAAMVGVGVGKYYQISNNFHAYLETIEPVRGLIDYANSAAYRVGSTNPYEIGMAEPYHLVSDPSRFDFDLSLFLENPISIKSVYSNKFFSDVARPLITAFHSWKELKGSSQRFKSAYMAAGEIAASDLRIAMIEWLNRRETKLQTAGESK